LKRFNQVQGAIIFNYLL